MNQGPLDLQSNALPLSYTPMKPRKGQLFGFDKGEMGHFPITEGQIQGTAGVVVSCKIPILATRVRFPGSAKMFFPPKLSNLIAIGNPIISGPGKKKKLKHSMRGHPGLNWGPLDLQSNALPLSYTPLLE